MEPFTTLLALLVAWLITRSRSRPAAARYSREFYQSYIRSDAWRRKRAEALYRAGYRCQVCKRWENLEVHHNTYERLGREAPSDLTVLCARCHGLFHRAGRIG